MAVVDTTAGMVAMVGITSDNTIMALTTTDTPTEIAFMDMVDIADPSEGAAFTDADF